MTFFLASLSKQLRRVLGQPWSLAIWIGVPMLVGALLSAVMGGEDGETPKVHLLLADEDGSFLSGALIETLSSEDFGQLLIIERVAGDEGMAKLDADEASALLVVPEGFQSAFLASEAQALTLVTNPLQSILPAMAEELARTLAEFGSYAQLAFGPELRRIGEVSDAIRDETMTSDEIAQAIGALAEGGTGKLMRAVPKLSGAPVEIDVRTTEGALEASFILLFFPGLLMMSVIFAAQGLAEDLWAERDMGTLRRLKTTAASSAAGFAARIAGMALATAAVVLPLTTIGFTLLELPYAKLPMTIVWLALAGLLLAALASVIQVLAPSRKAGALFSMLVFFPLMLVGGSFFPFESMPDFLTVFGRLTPNGMMLEPLKRFLIGTGDLAGFVPALSIALIATAVLTAFTIWRVETRFAAR
ncbi:MAG: ABC transporter permease [Paracoccaceae bacterium]|nr:ABC transporter permease [Paracoccaceae bacterium]